MKVLFICKGNWYRSQIAEEIYNRLTNTKDAYSVGVYVGAVDEPEGRILENLFVGKFENEGKNLFSVMDSNNFNIRKNITKKTKP
jgi:protein-tyrosine-phosphatase